MKIYLELNHAEWGCVSPTWAAYFTDVIVTMNAVNKITIIGLIQTLVIFIGFYVLGLVMKIQGYPNMETIQMFARPSSFWLRQHGLILLLVPILWTLSSVVQAAKNRQDGAINIGLVIGILFALALGFAFLYASWDTLVL